MRFLAFIFLVFFLSLYTSCNRKHENWKGGVIKEYGIYTLSNRRFTIDVKSRNGLLDYKVFGINSELIFETAENSSCYSTWFMFWDTKNDALWISSSDIGIFVWIKSDKEGKHFKKEIMRPNYKLPLEMPNDFYRELPQSMK